MLQITTSNGNVLVHADQHPDSYNGQSADGSTYMVHGGSWGNHKYIRKEGNRYIYPEDLQKAAANQKQKIKDKKFVKEGGQTIGVKRNDQILSAHGGALKKYDGPGKTAIRPGASGISTTSLEDRFSKEERKAMRKSSKTEQQRKSAHDGYERDKKIFPDGGSTEELEIQKQKTKDRKYVKSSKKKSALQQQKEAHAGYEADKKKFPDGGSTEELERQKDKTKARKTQKRVEEVLQKKKDRITSNRPKSRQKKVVSGGKNVKTGKSAGGGKAHP